MVSILTVQCLCFLQFQYEGDTNLFEDDDTRCFYENLPDLRAVIPGVGTHDTESVYTCILCTVGIVCLRCFSFFFSQGKPAAASHAVCPDKSPELVEFLYNLAGTVFLYCCDSLPCSWTILGGMGHNGSWCQKQDWAQHWPEVILNELGRGCSWDWKSETGLMFLPFSTSLSNMTCCDLAYYEWPQVSTISSLVFDFVTWCDLPHEYS